MSTIHRRSPTASLGVSVIESHDAHIQPQTSELLPAGNHQFLDELPTNLRVELKQPYASMVVFWQHRPTGGSSWNPLKRYLYNNRLRKQLPQLLEAIRLLEDDIKTLKLHHSKTAPQLIAQAQDLLWYMRKEPGDPELNAIFDAVRAVTPEMGQGLLGLSGVAIDLLNYFDSLAERRSRQSNENVRFVLDVHYANAVFLMEKIAERVGVPVDLLVKRLRDTMSKR